MKGEGVSEALRGRSLVLFGRVDSDRAICRHALGSTEPDQLMKAAATDPAITRARPGKALWRVCNTNSEGDVKYGLSPALGKNRKEARKPATTYSLP